MKRIAILGAGIYNIGVYEKIRSAHFFTIAVDGDEAAPAAAFADEFVHLNFADKYALLKWAEAAKPDGIMALNDHGTISAAFVAEKLGLPGIAEDAAIAACDKGIMRDKWKNAGLGIPDYFVFRNQAELEQNIHLTGFPCVVKPAYSGGGGRGISVLKSIADIAWAWEFAKPHAKNGRYICESFIEGTELTIETISLNGEVRVLAMSDKEKPELRTRVATSLNYPAKLNEDQERLVTDTIGKAVKALGITTGMAHTEAIINGMELKLVETGARGGGSMIYPLIIEKVSGINAPAVCADILTGGHPAIPIPEKNGVVYRFFNPPLGRLLAVHNVDVVRAKPWVLSLELLKKPGDIVGDLKNSFERAGHIVVSGNTREEALQHAAEAESQVVFESAAL